MAKVLLTSIEPFGEDTVNSSTEAVRMVGANLGPDVEVSVVELSCVYGRALTDLRRAIERADPDLVVATGQASRRADVTVEMVAINLDHSVATDNHGHRAKDEPVVADGPAAYFSSLPVRSCVAAILAAGVPASASYSAGTYLCNHIAYGLAHLIATERPAMRGGFVHVPATPVQISRDTAMVRPPSMASTTAADALRAVIRTAVADLSPHDRPAAGSRRGRLRSLLGGGPSSSNS